MFVSQKAWLDGKTDFYLSLSLSLFLFLSSYMCTRILSNCGQAATYNNFRIFQLLLRIIQSSMLPALWTLPSCNLYAFEGVATPWPPQRHQHFGCASAASLAFLSEIWDGNESRKKHMMLFLILMFFWIDIFQWFFHDFHTCSICLHHHTFPLISPALARPRPGCCTSPQSRIVIRFETSPASLPHASQEWVDSVSTKGWWLIVDGDGVCDDDDDDDDDAGGDDDDDDGMGDTVALIAWKSLYVLYDQNLGREYPIRINKKKEALSICHSLVDVSITALAKLWIWIHELWSPRLASRHLLRELSQRRHSFRP